MKHIEVQIMDQSYLLGCPEGGEMQLREAVERVDATMCRIRDAGKVKARDRIAVLASLNLAYDLVQHVAAVAATAEADADAKAQTARADDTTDAPDSTEATDATDAHDADDRAAQLLRRLDQALAGDGHLL